MNTKKVSHSEVFPGDKVMPPIREVNLWMKRDAIAMGLPLESLLLTVKSITQNYKKDKDGEWTFIDANYSMEFSFGHRITFLMRPTTKIEKAVA